MHHSLFHLTIFQIFQLLPPSVGFTVEQHRNTITKESQLPLLGCKEINQELITSKKLKGGYVKYMELGEILGLPVVLSRPRSPELIPDFIHGIEMLLAFRNSSVTVQLIGYCLDKGKESMVTRYYRNGGADTLEGLIKELSMSPKEEFKLRLQLVEDYLTVLLYLHNSPVGTRVMCDSNDLMKTMSQYVISDDYHLLLADVDALPEVILGHSGIKCGRKQLFGSFVAPEQLWPWPNSEFDDELMPEYSEKIDIWKIPDVLSFLLGNYSDGTQFKLAFFAVFQECKAIKPSERPTSSFVYNEFKKLKQQLGMIDRKHHEL